MKRSFKDWSKTKKKKKTGSLNQSKKTLLYPYMLIFKPVLEKNASTRFEKYFLKLMNNMKTIQST